MVVSKSWKDDTSRLFIMETARCKSEPGCGIWQSEGIKVKAEKTKSRRILVVGDSFVTGGGLANINDAWWRLLQRELIRRGFNDVEVFAVYPANPIGSFAHELIQVEQWASKYHPDLIVWGYVSNDCEEAGPKHMVVRYLRSNEPGQFEKVVKRVFRGVFPNLAETTLAFQDRCYADSHGNDEIGYESKVRELKLLEGENFKRFEDTVQRTGRFVKSSGIPTFVVTLPALAGWCPEENVGKSSNEYFDYLQRYYRERFEPVTLLFKKSGIVCFDLLGNYIKALRNEPRFACSNASMLLASTPTDGHPGVFITHFYAQQVANILEKSYPQILGAKSQTAQKASLNVNDWFPPNMNVVKVAPRSYSLIYPRNELMLLRMPMRKAHIQLNFEMPISLKQVRLRSPFLKSANLWVTTVDQKTGYDMHEFRNLGAHKGTDEQWVLNEEWANYINTIEISADIRGDGRLIVDFQ